MDRVEGVHSLRVHRMLKGWTQTELGRRTGVHSKLISLYESEKVVPSGPTLQKLARELGVDANCIDLSYADREAA